MWNGFDILKKLPDGGIVWIETAKSLEAARERIKLFAAHKPGEYAVFCQERQEVMKLPWITHPRQEFEAADRRGKKTARKGHPEKFSTKPNTKQIIREIVADIARAAARKK
jgi:hypothetical protein